MTLILTIANALGVYQSSDYQLTNIDTGEFFSDHAGSKQLNVSLEKFDVHLSFTGIAEVGAGSTRQCTIDCLSEELKELKKDYKLQDVCEALANRSYAVTSPLGKNGLLILVLTVATLGEPFRVAVISNADWLKRPPEAKPNFTIKIHKITKPFHLISGCRWSVPTRQRHRLRALAKDTLKSQEQVMEALADINAIASKNSNGYVSKACWVTSQYADGRLRRYRSRNIGKHRGDISQLLYGSDLSEWPRKNVRGGHKYRLKESVGVRCVPGDDTPLPPPSGELRHFTLSGSSVTALLRSPTGEQCASIDIFQLECDLEMRCNEGKIVPFSKVTLSGRYPISRAFQQPLLPWLQVSPTLVIDDAMDPQGWEYSVCYWIEDDAHHVILPIKSRSIRNLAFLGPEDEITIAAPSTEMKGTWDEREEPLTATVYARVRWRSRR